MIYKTAMLQVFVEKGFMLIYLLHIYEIWWMSAVRELSVSTVILITIFQNTKLTFALLKVHNRLLKYANICMIFKMYYHLPERMKVYY